MIGKSIGPYTVQSLLGRGGMGEVYRARDSRLDRDVALKVLPDNLSADPDRLGRFEREARLLAALQHQNIASIYGLEECDGQPVLVMELAEGDDLSVRLGAGALDVDEVERVARQLARGLEFAHERGIIHRDLKPANVKLGPDGRVKILDFGLARAFGGPGESSSGAAAMSQETLPPELTRPGTVLGTAAYMSPEQARGYEVDRRTDIWAFGVILYEMLTGSKLFAGETASDTLAAILRQDPDLDRLPEHTPPVMVQLIQRCLQKDPQVRLRDIGEVRIALEDGSSSFLGSAVGSRPLEPALLPPTGRSSRAPWLVVAVLGLLLGAVSFLGFGGRLGPAPEAAPMVRSQILLSDQTSLHLNPANPGPPVVSPDGRAVAFSAVDSTGQIMLYVRRLADAEARPLGGTLGAAYPFWSPGSQALGFFRDGNLCRIDIAGGPVVNICAADNGKGGSWNQDDVIIFAPSHISSIYRVAATGGPAEDITTVAADSMVRSHRFPHWLPDGRHFLYLAWHTGQRGLENETVLRLASLDGTVDRDLCPSQTSAQYAAGHLLYIHDNNLMGRPFSVADLEFTGPPRPILGEVLALQAAHVAVFSATDAGVLAYAGGSGIYGQSRLHWHAGDGTAHGELPQVFLSPQGLDLSPDGRRLAIAEADQRRGTFDIWVYEMGRDVGARFTFDNESELYPTWSSDGRWITYIMTASGQSQIVRKQASGAGQPEVLTRTVDSGAAPTDWSADDRKLLFTSIGSDGDTDIWLLDLDDPDSPRPIRSTPFNEGQASFSPDDRWIVYRSLESGIADVFVESLDAAGGRYRISAAGGHRPTWAPDASAIYYVDLTGRLQRTDIAIADGSLSIGQTTTITDGIEASLNRVYALDPAQDRILVQRPVAGQASNRLELITGWEGLLGR